MNYTFFLFDLNNTMTCLRQVVLPIAQRSFKLNGNCQRVKVKLKRQNQTLKLTFKRLLS